MTIFTILSHTPLWVWILFAFLIMRGYAALSEREMNISQLFILPLLFLIWGVWGLKEEFNFNVASLVGMFSGLALGIVAGWRLWKYQPRLKNKPHSDRIIRAGTPLTLILARNIVCWFGCRCIRKHTMPYNSAPCSALLPDLLMGYSGVGH